MFVLSISPTAHLYNLPRLMQAANNIPVQPETKQRFPVVGIGASAGGLEAIKSFLQALPEKTEMAFVYVQHLSPDHESALPEILQKFSKIPVLQISDDVELEKDRFYVIPSNKLLTTYDGHLKLEDFDLSNKKIKTIDLFFSSLGAVHQSFAVGIVLSGALNDGTLGLQVIKAHGGMTFAQDEGSAAFDSMPKSAAKSGAVDFVFPPAKIAEHLISANKPFGDTVTTTKLLKKKAPQADEEVYKQLLTVLRVRRGIDFTNYKPSTLKRRIVRRMALNNVIKPTEYLDLLRNSKAEQDALFDDMLISVTDFFRDEHAFKTLCSSILPAILKSKSKFGPLRIWVAGCATGQEAYSMAICIHEYLGDRSSELKVQIFASDISKKSIAKARSGTYKKTDLDGLSADRLQQYFTKLDGSYTVNKSIREMCVFADHNLLKDPPFSRMDLISCRNVLIYLEPVLQTKAIQTFHYSLNPKGYLMLGKSEALGSSAELFSAVNSQEKIYTRKSHEAGQMTVTSKMGEQLFRDVDEQKSPETKLAKDIFKLSEDVLLGQFTPAGVLVNDRYDIVQFRGETDKWLTPAPGKASLHLLKMVRDGLAFELRNLLLSASKTQKPVRKINLAFKSRDRQLFADIDVAPVKGADDLHFLVLFKDSISANVQQPDQNNGDAESGDGGHRVIDTRVDQLEKELEQLRSDMRTVTEDQEAANEELLSANQELMSGSEELQSLNEELETSKEELESTNEEILAVNSELTDRNTQLNNARIYKESMLDTVRDPLLILDERMRVKRASKPFLNQFKVTEAEIEGHLLFELANGQWNIPEIWDLLHEKLPKEKQSRDIEFSHVFPGIGHKLLCLNARSVEPEHGENLIILAIEDITAKRLVQDGHAEVEKLLSENKERLRFAIEAGGLGTWDYYPLSGQMIWDDRSRRLFNLSAYEPVDMDIFLSKIHEDDRERISESVHQSLAGFKRGESDMEFRIGHGKTVYRWIKSRGKVHFDANGVAERFAGVAMDFTATKSLELETKDLLRKKDEFFSIASHELKTPITSLKASLQLIEKVSNSEGEYKKIKMFAHKAIRQAGKLTSLITDLLDVTRIQSGHLVLEKSWFSMSDLLSECAENMQDQSNKHILKIADEADVKTVFADKIRIEQVIVNLLSNAIKYSPEGKQVVIKVQRLKNDLKVSVSDSGIGIPEEQQHKLFDRFFRVEEVSKSYSGLGLGLFISSEIVNLHKGKMGVESKVNDGSTFWFSIPIGSGV